MTTSHTARGLASLGRHGDSMLVHMSPYEVAGLNYLAKKQGTKLTINPHTGLPEAFSLGGFFKSLLPTIAGGIVSMIPGLQPFGLSAMQAGILAGAATGALTNKKNPLMGAALGGLGGYGGVGIGDALSKTMAITSPAAAASSGVGATISGVGPGAVGTTGQIGGANLIGSGVAGGTAASRAAAQNIMGAMNNAGVNVADPIVQDMAKNALQTLPKTSNFSGINVDPTSSFLKSTPFDQAYGASTIQPSGTMGGSTLIGEGRNLANSAASAQNPLIAGAMSNSPTPGFGETFIDQLGGTSGAVKKLGLPIGGAALLGGLEPSDLYGEPINMDAAKKKQAYDPNATLNLSGDTGLRLYAVGGTVTTGGLRDLYGTADNNTNPQLSRDGYGVGRLDSLAREQAMTQAQTTGYADGGEVSNYGQNQAALNLDRLPSLNLGNGSSGQSEMMQKLITGFRNMGETGPSPGVRKVGNWMSEGLSNPQVLIDMVREGKMPQGYAMGGPVSFADGGDSNKEDAMGLPSLSPDMSMDPNAGAVNLAMIQSAMQPTQGMQGNAPMTQGQMPDQSNDSLIAKVTANLKVDPNYQPENPIEAAIVKQIKGTDPMQQGQPGQQGLASLGPAQPSQPMAPSFNPSQSMAPSFNPSVAMGPTYYAGMNAPQGYADGGEVSNYGQNQAALNLDRLPSLNLSNGSSGQSEAFQRVLTGFGELSERGPSPGHRRVGDFMSGLLSYDPVIIDMIRGGKAPQGYAEGGETSMNLDTLPSLNLNTGTNSPIVAVANTRPKFSFPSMGRMGPVGIGIQGGINPLPWYEQLMSNRPGMNYAHGGYLDGQGDGMSDSIPATIEGKQPARLADGEFVVPADVVSHLGNGSSKAGSKRLYAMLDKVRHARTGNKKQGKEIKADKYLPA